MIKVFKSKFIELLDENEKRELVVTFRSYKQNNVLPDLFGRDVPYDHPDSLPSLKQNQVMHIHLADKESPWPLHIIQYKKTSDTHLVYCQGSVNTECYLLMAILKPDAHELAWNRKVMIPLATMAEKFRAKY